MAFRLKGNCERFEIADGPDRGRIFEPGVTYESVPAGEYHRFEKIATPEIPAAAEGSRERAGKKTGARGGDK